MDDDERQRWIQPERQRYYQGRLTRDLFGDWTLVQAWGSIGSHRGQLRIVPVPSPAKGVRRIRALGQLRQRHGYVQENSPDI